MCEQSPIQIQNFKTLITSLFLNFSIFWEKKYVKMLKSHILDPSLF